MNSVISYFKNTVKKYPERIAVEDVNGEITYSALDELSEKLAGGILKELDTYAKNKPVLVYLPKQIESVVAYVGILKTGNPYVPVDYQIPMQRLKTTIDNLKPAMIIADSQGIEKLEAEGFETDAKICNYEELVVADADVRKTQEILVKVVDTDPCYIMYTSGTTGVPKGVVIPHRGVEDYANWLIDEFKITKEQVFGLQSGFHFDNSVFDMYCSFFTGAKMVIIPEILFMYPTKLIPYMNEKKIDIIFWVPTVMISVADSGVFEEVLPEYLKTVVFAGEVMPNKQLNSWRRVLPQCVYANLYGPTEITVDCLYYIVDREFADNAPLPIGIDCPNKRILILKEDNTLAGVNEQGEICVLGCGVGLGYWNNPEVTAKAFCQNPLNKNYREIMYRTGDIGYRTEEGLVMYVGRGDSQFKLRGNRIELGEIENNALSVTGVERACALFDAENQEIVVFVKAKSEINLRKFNLELKQLVPKYMLPSKLFLVDEFPYNQNNKIDRLALKKKYIDKKEI